MRFYTFITAIVVVLVVLAGTALAPQIVANDANAPFSVYMPLINAVPPISETIQSTPMVPAIPSPAPTPALPSVPAFRHIFVIVMENKEDSQIFGNSDAPYINELAQKYGRATNFYGTTHPSLPNYLAMIGGDTFGINSDCTDCFVDAPNLVDQLEARGKSWKAYMESMPAPCFVGNAVPYAQKHNPFIYFDNIRNDPARCGKIVPFTQFSTDVLSNTLPDFVWITPDLCSDMHDCPVGTGDAWLQRWVSRILASPAWQDNGALFITFDEGYTAAGCCTYAAGGKIATLVISPLGRTGFESDVPYDHYSLLRTIEEAWNMPLLGKADCGCSPPMVDFFQTN